MTQELSHYQRWINQHNHKELREYVPFIVNGETFGAVHPKRHQGFRAHPDVFVFTPQGISLHPRLSTPELRSATIAEVLQSWRQAGWVRGWRDEHYRVSNTFNTPPALCIERAAASTFGIIRYGVHVNGMVWSAGKLHIWIARRADDKPEFPGMLDHIVAGGIPAGYTVRDVVIKECDEEAAIPQNIATTAYPVSALTYAYTSGSSIKRSCVFVYDLVLPESFIPHNNDGEVQSFELMPIEDVLVLVRDTDDFKPNNNLVLIDLFARYGLLTPDMPGYTAVIAGLRSPLTI